MDKRTRSLIEYTLDVANEIAENNDALASLGEQVTHELQANAFNHNKFFLLVREVHARHVRLERDAHARRTQPFLEKS